jgi:hypothetical protein
MTHLPHGPQTLLSGLFLQLAHFSRRDARLFRHLKPVEDLLELDGGFESRHTTGSVRIAGIRTCQKPC